MPFDAVEHLRRVFARVPSDLPAAARHYAAAGFPVFPVAVNGTVPLLSKREGGNGYKDATCDLEKIRTWWSAWPRANIGLVTGLQFDVLDLDAKNGNDGPKLWSDEVMRGGFPEEVIWVERTPNGLHLYLMPKGVRRKAPVSKDMRGVDYLGTGGYVVVAPSVAKGRAYIPVGKFTPPCKQTHSRLDILLGRTEEPRTSSEVVVPDRPAREPDEPGTPYGLAALEDEYERVSTAVPGERNTQLFKSSAALGELVAADELDQEYVIRRLWEAAEVNGLVSDPDDGPSATRQTIASGLSKGLTNPRDVEAGLLPVVTPSPKPKEPTRKEETADARRADEPEAVVDRFELLVANELLKRRVRQEAGRRWTLELIGERPQAPMMTLGEVLANPVKMRWRVDHLLPVGVDNPASTVIVAQNKAGKTTLCVNLVRSLLTGQPFLESFEVATPVTGRVAYMNYEVSAGQLASWFPVNGLPVAQHDRLLLLNLRGYFNPFAETLARERLAETLRRSEVETLVVDPFGRAYTGESQNDAAEVGAWLNGLDEFVHAAGVKDVYLVVHSGWDNSRARGSSALQDWGDANFTLMKGKVNADGDVVALKGADAPRLLRAEGREVALPLHRLVMDPATFRLAASLVEPPVTITVGKKP